MASKVFQDSSGQKKRSFRFGAGRLMTFKEAKSIPDFVLKRNLAALDVKKDRVALKMKREEVNLELTLQSLNTSFGEYANVETAEDVRKELKKGIRKQMNAQREQQERARAAEKAAQGHEDQPSNEDGEVKKAQESRLPTPVREAMRRRKRDALARKQKHPRPKYSELVMDDRKQRQYNNNRSYDRLMESYGRGKNDEKLEAWLDMMYPRMDHMSATIIGMKKRLERFQSREAMLTNPKEGGMQTLMNDYKVYSMYPEVLKEKRRRMRQRPGSGGSSGSQDSRSNIFNRVPKLPPIKSESESSLGGVSEGDVHLELEKSSKNGSVRSGESRRKKGQQDSDGSIGSNGKSKDEAASGPPFKLPPTPKKGILHNAPIQAKPNVKSTDQGNDEVDAPDPPPKKEKKKVAIMTPIMSREGTQVENGGTEQAEAKTDAERQEEEDELAEFAAFRERMRNSVRRRSSVNPKTLAQAAENKRKIEEIKQQILAMRRGENRGEADFEMEMSRRKSLMLLMGDDYDEEDMEWLVEVEDPAKLWKDVKSCRYLRGHDPAEMTVPDGPLQEFVFWKGEFAQESSFEREQNEKKMKESADGGVEGAGYDSDVGAINSVEEATRRVSLVESARRKSVDNILKNN